MSTEGSHTKKLERWEVHWINGHASAKGTTLINAVKKMNL